jgi:recombinational DNA repair protein RecT
MKTPLQKLIEQLDQKIELVNRYLETQDEVGVFMYTGLLAGFMESKVMAEKLLENEKEQIIKSYNESFLLRDKPYETAEKYYNEKYK